MSINLIKPSGNEIKISPRDILVTRTDHQGVINYCNDTFLEVTGYTEREVIGANHNIVRHPDMPKVIFHLMWKSIKKRKNITSVLKNIAKNGNHYWVITDFKTDEDFSGSIKNHTAYRRAIPKNLIETIEPLYQTLLKIEQEQDMDASIKYLNRYLADRDMDYNQFIENLLQETPMTELLRNKIKKLFS